MKSHWLNGVKLDHLLLRPGDPLLHHGRDCHQVEAVCLRLVGAGGRTPKQLFVDTRETVGSYTSQEMFAAHPGVHRVHLSLEAGPGPLDLLHQQREVELVPVVRTVNMSLDILDM